MCVRVECYTHILLKGSPTAHGRCSYQCLQIVECVEMAPDLFRGEGDAVQPPQPGLQAQHVEVLVEPYTGRNVTDQHTQGIYGHTYHIAAKVDTLLRVRF